MFIMLNLLFLTSCRTIEEISPSPYKTESCTTVVGSFGARCFAYDELFVSQVFAKGAVGYNLAIENINLISEKQVTLDSPQERELYLWLTALSTFYWPSIYNPYDINKDTGIQIENLYCKMLKSNHPGVVEACLGMLFLHRNIVNQKLIRAIMQHSASKEKNIAELANVYCNRFFFVDDRIDTFPYLAFSNITNDNLDEYIEYWRYPIPGYAPPTRNSLRKQTINIIKTNSTNPNPQTP
jgi:hypothetical protein